MPATQVSNNTLPITNYKFILSDAAPNLDRFLLPHCRSHSPSISARAQRKRRMPLDGTGLCAFDLGGGEAGAAYRFTHIASRKKASLGGAREKALAAGIGATKKFIN